MPDLPLHLRLIRAALRRLNISLSRRRERRNWQPPGERDSLGALEIALRKLRLDDPASQAYFDKHLPRLRRTLSLVPAPHGAGRVLELGCYLQLTPALKHYAGYREVYGADYGSAGVTRHKAVRYGDDLFELDLLLFDAERDIYPYPSGHFELVLACELIEHMLFDPMHLLLEARRVLEEDGRILITTPNIAGLTSVARVLHGHDNPQLHSKYKIPTGGAREVQHVREYTLAELRDLVVCAGFEIEQLFTEPIAEYSFYQPLLLFLEENGYNPADRGEQSYCVARKRSSLPITRYPEFLYEP